MAKTKNGITQKLSPEGLQALKGSIKKWEGICNGTEVDKGFHNCPLCTLFVYTKKGIACRGCPVYKRTGQDCCNGTPYQTFVAWAEYDPSEACRRVSGPLSRQAAKDELEFLKSLLPKPTMSKEWLKALKGSIKKWEKIVDRKGRDEGQLNCPLCVWANSVFRKDMKYNYNYSTCVGCPVHKRTGRSLCLRSPYMKWQNYQKKHTGRCIHLRVWDETSQKLAEAELAFLKSLLPEEV